MSEPQFGDHDDLPRTLRRERDLREAQRAAQAHAQSGGQTLGQPAGSSGHGDPNQHHGAAPDYGAGDPQSMYGFGMPGTVNRIEVPFRHLMWFFIKAVFASIPALILLTGLLFGGGKVLQSFFPQLRLFEIVIKTPDVQVPAIRPSEATKAAPPAATPAAKK